MTERNPGFASLTPDPDLVIIGAASSPKSQMPRVKCPGTPKKSMDKGRDYYKMDNEANSAEEQGSSDVLRTDNSPLLNLAAELLDKIVLQLDAKDLYNLERTSNSTKQKINPISSSERGQLIWKEGYLPRLISGSPSTAKNIVSSYNTTLDEQRRKEAVKELELYRETKKIIASPLRPLKNFQPVEIVQTPVSWKDVYDCHKTFLGKISHLPVYMELMKDTERLLKENFERCYQNLNQPLKPRKTKKLTEVEKICPMQFISTVGPTLYHFMAPVAQNKGKGVAESVTFYENMTESRRHTLELLRHQVIHSCKTVVFHFSGDTVDTRPILILQTTGDSPSPGLWLCPVLEGRPMHIPVTVNVAGTRPPPPYAVFGNYLAIFEGPNLIKTYHITVLENGELYRTPAAQLTRQDISNGPNFLKKTWKYIVEHGDAFYFGLGQDTSYPSVIGKQRTLRADHTSPEHLVFKFVFAESNPAIVNRHIGAYEPIQAIYGYATYVEHILGNKAVIFSYDHDTLLFWTPKALVCPYGFSAVAVREWQTCHEKIREVSLLEIIENRTIMLCSNRKLYQGFGSCIILAKIVFEYPNVVDRAEIDFSLQIIRMITPRLEILKVFKPTYITKCHFDFDRGRPYIFLITARDNRPRDFEWSWDDVPIEDSIKRYNEALNFELMKITFHNLDEELENGETVVNDMLPTKSTPSPPPSTTAASHATIFSSPSNAKGHFPDKMLASLMKHLKR